MSIVLQILSLLFVVLWTGKLARNKGRNALVWGGVAAIPVIGLLDIFPEWITVLCMVPMLALVFMPGRRTMAADGAQEGMTPCPRCQHPNEAGPTFCTNCGWELARPYATAESGTTTAEAGETAAAQGMVQNTESAQDPESGAVTTETPAAQPSMDPVMASQQAVGVDAATPTGTVDEDAEAAPAFAVAPLKITRPLTAAGMTELGLSLFNQGRVREAVDQFTKAIALDPRYREAWANRARAYTELGLSDKAAADRQQLEAI